MKIFEPHEFSLIFRPHTKNEIDELVADIERNGQSEEALVYEGKLLDGNGRQAACSKLGIQLKYKDFEGNRDQAIEKVKSLNLVRRHLTDDERACVAADIAKLQKRTNSIIAIKNGVKGRTIPRLAKEMNVSQRKIREAIYLKTHEPEKFEQCKNGEAKVGATFNRVNSEARKSLSLEKVVPTVFWGDRELSEYISSLSKEGWNMRLECWNGRYICKFIESSIEPLWDGADIRESMKGAIVWAINKLNASFKGEVLKEEL